jgi:FKBP-type peptidyl-prolyl cis-trans isomerase
MRFAAIAAVVALMFISGCGGGVKITDLKVGDGPAAKNGDKVTVHYTGWLSNGKKFDSSLDDGKPYSFYLGQGKVIKGWDEGLVGMKVGGKRKLVIAPEKAYGDQPPRGLPPNAELTFEVELLAIE